MNYFQRYLAEEFAEDYSEGRISRRKALKLIVSVTGSTMVANTLLAACAPATETPGVSPQSTIPVTGTQTPETTPTAEGSNATVAPEDPDVKATAREITGQDGAKLVAYLAQPAAGSPAPVVLVCHENRGLTNHIRDVTRRLAKAGYVALAMDLLSRQGGTGKVGNDNAPGALGAIDPDQFVQDFLSGWEFLKDQSFAQTERVGMVGFCFGGGVTWRVATKMPQLRAAVPYYGPPPPVEELATVQAAVLAIYGGNDTRINASIPAVEEAMKKNNKIYEKVIYEGADHAFNNDTGPRYNAKAANDAWGRTLAWFKKYLRG